MNSIASNCLLETFCRAVETLAFLSPMPAEQPYHPPDALLLVQLSLTEKSGAAQTLELVTGVNMGALIVSNLMGAEPESFDSQSRALDSLKELANVVGGQVAIATSAGACEPPELGIPRVRPFNADRQWRPFVEDPQACVVDVEGNLVAMRIRGGE